MKLRIPRLSYRVGSIVLAALVLSQLTSCQSTVRPPHSSVSVTDPVRDLGIIAVGSPAITRFPVANEGSEPLRLDLTSRHQDLRVPQSVEVAARSRGEIRVELDTWTLYGPNDVKITYATNDPARPSVHLGIKVIVEPKVVAWPGRARYEFVQMEKAGTIAQTLWATDGGEFTVTSVESPFPWLTTSFREATETERIKDKPGAQWRVETTIQPDAAVGPVAALVKVKLGGSQQPELRLPVTGFVRPLFAATPASADLRVVRLGKPLERSSISIQNFGTEKIQLTRVTLDTEGLEPAIEFDDGHMYRVRLKVTDEAKEGPFTGTIRVFTSSEKQPVIEIPLRGTFVE